MAGKRIAPPLPRQQVRQGFVNIISDQRPYDTQKTLKSPTKKSK